MKENNLIKEKSFAFSIRVVNLYKHLCADKKVSPLFLQLLRAGTSIGANVEEAIGGQSRRDFSAKMSIAYKEARETSYWIRLLYATEVLTDKQFESIHKDAEELIKILTKILVSTKDKEE